jgi:hypothetical protein
MGYADKYGRINRSYLIVGLEYVWRERHFPHIALDNSEQLSPSILHVWCQKRETSDLSW